MCRTLSLYQYTGCCPCSLGRHDAQWSGPGGLSEFNQIDSGAISQQVCPMVRQIAQEEGLGLAEAHDSLLPFPECFAVDGVHPNAEGEFFIATVVYITLTSDTRIGHERLTLRPVALPGAAKRIIVHGLQPGAKPIFPGAALFDLLGRGISASGGLRPGLESLVIEVHRR